VFTQFDQFFYKLVWRLNKLRFSGLKEVLELINPEVEFGTYAFVKVVIKD
jgi:hypothetical protein